MRIKENAIFKKEYANMDGIADMSVLRALEASQGQVLVVDCLKASMPYFEPLEALEGYGEIGEDELLAITDISFLPTSEMCEKAKTIMRKRMMMIAPILPFLGDKHLRNEAIRRVAQKNDLSKQSIRHYLCLYLVYQDERALAPIEEKERELNRNEKNMRAALNKYFYNGNRNTLKTSYTLMLYEKYVDGEGRLLEKYPSFYQFRYFYRKTRDLQKFYISRNGLSEYQRNERPLLGDGVQEFAPGVGVGMFDSTICDIYLVNEANEIVGRPILTACVDAYSSLCMGYCLTWEGGMYSLRNLLLNMVEDKQEHCKKMGIDIDKGDWNVSSLPYKFVTDKGKEYASENFEQLSGLGIEIVNLPPYRPELKGPIEKFFDCVQGYYKPYLKGKGVIEPDFQERGKHDYRKDACLTMRDFEKVIVRCILFYNTKRILKNFPFTKSMIEEKIKPIAKDVFDYGERKRGCLIDVTKEELAKTLLPRTRGQFKRNGLIVNGLRYMNKDFVNEYLQGKEEVVSYNPDDVSKVWIFEKGAYIEFSLIEKRFSEMSLCEIDAMREAQSGLVASMEQEKLQAEIDLANDIMVIGNYANKPTKKSTKGIRKTREKEETRVHRDYMKGVMA